MAGIRLLYEEFQAINERISGGGEAAEYAP